MGLKLHEDWGTTPAAIDNCLAVAEEYDIQVRLLCANLFPDILFLKQNWQFPKCTQLFGFHR